MKFATLLISLILVTSIAILCTSVVNAKPLAESNALAIANAEPWFGAVIRVFSFLARLAVRAIKAARHLKKPVIKFVKSTVKEIGQDLAEEGIMTLLEPESD